MLKLLYNLRLIILPNIATKRLPPWPLKKRFYEQVRNPDYWFLVKTLDQLVFKYLVQFSIIYPNM